MARITDEDIARVTENIDLVALIQSKGVVTTDDCGDVTGVCPFCGAEGKFHVDPEKKHWQCDDCDKSGDVLDFIAEAQGISLRHAYEILLSGDLSSIMKGKMGPKKATVTILDSPVEVTDDQQALYYQVLTYYHSRLKQLPEASDYLLKRGIMSEEAIDTFLIGFADRTLGLRLPSKNRVEGRAMRQFLKQAGILREDTGHEHFNGCVVFPVMDEDGKIQQIYGRKINRGLRNGTSYHLYLPGGHQGIWNPICLKGREIILCEGIMDALTFWVHGFHYTTCIFDPQTGISDELLQSILKAKIQSVRFAYDHDAAGMQASKRDAEKLMEHGIDCYRINFPKNMDANKFVCQSKHPGTELKKLVQGAEWLGRGKGNEPQVVVSPTHDVSLDEFGVHETLISKEKDHTPSEVVKPSRPSDVAVRKSGEDYIVDIGDRQYRVRGLQNNGSCDVLRINLRLWFDGLYYVNVLDLYQAKHRNNFVTEAAEETKLKSEIIKRDLGKLLLELENLQEQRIQEILAPQSKTSSMSDAEQAEALEFLQRPDMMDQLLADFNQCGVVGEDSNKLTGWLACVSRKLRKPLAVIVQSTSAAGKSTLMDAVLSFFPKEDQIRYSSMTGQSLYYLGEDQLKHRILAIAEEEGAQKASYALKLLQSEGKLTIASTGKDAETGRIQTEEYSVEGPVAIFLTTTAIDIDEELLNRCVILTVDEGEDQTRRIHERQRLARTFDGMLEAEQREDILNRHCNAQRLLKPYRIINDFAQHLTFVSSRTRNRRDHDNYLTLIDAVTLAHQHQRKIEVHESKAGSIEFIRVTLEDIAIANRLAAQVLGRNLDDLPPQTRTFLKQVQAMVKEACDQRKIDPADHRFTRAQVRAFTGLSQSQIKLHTDRLVDLEYFRCFVPQGRHFEYQLLIQPGPEEGKHMSCLLDVDELHKSYDAELSVS